jgi:hypothetical protein
MAQYEDITIDQGADVTLQLELVDTNNNAKNLTGHSVSARLKKTYTSTSYTDFLALIQAPATDGIVNLTLTNTQTDALEATRYVYDVELSYTDSDGDTIIERILEGQITVTPSVTR